jgi:hypothetical protein
MLQKNFTRGFLDALLGLGYLRGRLFLHTAPKLCYSVNTTGNINQSDELAFFESVLPT